LNAVSDRTYAYIIQLYTYNQTGYTERLRIFWANYVLTYIILMTRARFVRHTTLISLIRYILNSLFTVFVSVVTWDFLYIHGYDRDYYSLPRHHGYMSHRQKRQFNWRATHLLNSLFNKKDMVRYVWSIVLYIIYYDISA